MKKLKKWFRVRPAISFFICMLRNFMCILFSSPARDGIVQVRLGVLIFPYIFSTVLGGIPKFVGQPDSLAIGDSDSKVAGLHPNIG
jgi:hypothetical protein